MTSSFRRLALLSTGTCAAILWCAISPKAQPAALADGFEKIAKRRGLDVPQTYAVEGVAATWFMAMRCRESMKTVPDAMQTMSLASQAALMSNHLDDATMEMIGYLDLAGSLGDSIKPGTCAFARRIAQGTER